MDLKTVPNKTKTDDLTQGEEAKILTRKQIEAIPHLLGARSLEAGCKAARISKSSFHRWLKDENFKNELERQREEMINEALQRLKTSVTRAVDGLIELMEADEKAFRLRACEKVLDYVLKVKEIGELGDRLSKVEKIIWERRTYR